MASSHLPSGQSQIPSKRDKRRNLLSDRLTDLSVSFERDRDMHYRHQLNALQQDHNAISRADTSGRDLKLLDDGAEGIDSFVTGGAWLGDGAPMSNTRGSGGPAGTVQPGSFYAGFVAEVNEKMEERDVALAILHKQYHSKLAAIQTQHERSIYHAREEHINLAVTMKQRLINRLYNAKKKLSLDKDHLDISDTNALLLHPNQFSIGSAAAGVLGSPSRNDADRVNDIYGNGTTNGGNGNTTTARRKLRQRKNELDDLIMMGPGGIFDNFGRKNEENTDPKSAAAQRRKARQARYNRRINGGAGEDEETTMEDIYGNSHINGGTEGDGNNSGSNSAVGVPQSTNLVQPTQKQKQVPSTRNGHAAAVQQTQAQELLPKQVYSIEKLFTEKELQMAGNLAALATVKYFSKPKSKAGKKGKRGRVGDDDGVEAVTNEDSDAGTRTPRDDGEPKGNAGDISAATTTMPTLATNDEQAKTQEKDSAATPSLSHLSDLASLTPAALFSAAIARPANHVHSTNPSLPPTHATPLINPTALASHPPPPLSALNFMTPTSSGYGAPIWTSLGIPVSCFSAGNGSIVSSITTTKMMSMSAPCPGAAKGEEIQEDLELIRSGKGLGKADEDSEEDEEDEEEDEDDDPKGKTVDGRHGMTRERGRAEDKDKDKAKDTSLSPSRDGEKKVMGSGANVDEKEGGGGAEEKRPSLSQTLVVSEIAHGVKRRASSGPSGGAEKRVRKEKEALRDKEKEKEMMEDDAGEEGDAEEDS